MEMQAVAQPSILLLLFAPAGMAMIYLLVAGIGRFYDTPRYERTRMRPHESDAGLGLFLVYRSITILVGCLTPIIFVSAGLGIFHGTDTKLLGTLCAITAGLLWAGSNYARILLNAGPDESNRESVRQYHTSTTLGTVVRSVGLSLGFLCAMCFVIQGHNGSERLKFVGIAFAILSGAAYTIAGMLEKAWAGSEAETSN